MQRRWWQVRGIALRVLVLCTSICEVKGSRGEVLGVGWDGVGLKGA